MSKAASEPTALDAFMSRCLEIDDLLERLRALRDDHFHANPDNVIWGDVGSAGYVVECLRDALAHYGLDESKEL